jgi:hypothetical protein
MYFQYMFSGRAKPSARRSHDEPNDEQRLQTLQQVYAIASQGSAAH